MVTCGICHEENLTEIGELDSCDHSFCSACIQHWAQIESKCPFCKARFTSISRKVLDLEKLPDSDAESDDTVRQRFPGTVLDTLAVPERNQVYLGDAEWAGEGEGEDPLGDVVCMECGRGDDEDNLMLCDGCERACHTYCANLDALPEGDWFCWVCQENRDRQLAGEAVVDLTAVRRPQRSTRSTLVASDFTLPRARRRASSPGARSELSRRRRVRRRLVRNGDGLQPQRSGSGSQRLGSDADSILNALERSISARDHAGLSTTTEHRRLAGLRGAWNSVRQGYRPFPATTPPPPTQAPVPPVPVPQAVGSESQAWAAFEASRRAQDRTGLRAPRTSAGHPSGVQATLPGSPPVQAHSGQQSASSLARQAVAEARSRGRRLGPTGRQLASPNSRAHPPQLSSSSTLTVASERRRAREAGLQPPTSPRLTVPDPRPSLPHHSSLSVAPFARRRVREDGHRPPGSPQLRQRSRTPEELQRRRGQSSHWQEPHSNFGGSDNAGSAGGRRAALKLDRHRSQLRSSSSAQASLPRDASHIHRQTDAGQSHAHPLHWRSTGNATDNSSSAAPAASADVNIQNPNLIPVQQRWFGSPASAQLPQQWEFNPGSHHHSSWHNPLQAQQPMWATAPPAAFEASHSRPDLADGQPVGSQSHQQHTLGQRSHAPPLPPDDAAPPQSNPDKDGSASHVAQSHGHDREEDSSDSSTSQLASQQHAAQGLQAIHMAEVSGNRHHAHGSRDVAQRSADAGRETGAAISQAASEPRHRMTKQEAADAVKKLIKPLYAAKKLSKAEFKAVAQKCTHSLASDQTAAQGVHTIVIDCMKLLGLTEQSAFL